MLKHRLNRIDVVQQRTRKYSMSDGVIVAIIGTLGVIIAALIKAYADYRTSIHKELEEKSAQPKNQLISSWTIISGKWKILDDILRYEGPDIGNTPTPFGLVLGNVQLKSGDIEAIISFLDNPTDRDTTAHLLFGYDATSKAYYTAGVGG
jgi:hypothetical protein